MERIWRDCYHRARLASLAMVLAAASSAAAATEAARLLPADADLIVTVNVRAILHDHRDTQFVQRHLDQWRLALKGDEKGLKKYYQAQEVRKFEGIGAQEFL